MTQEPEQIDPSTHFTRHPERGSTDRAELDRLLDRARVGHVGLVADGRPLVIPTFVCRDGDRLLAHGSTGSSWMRALADGADACVAVTVLEGIVVARSTFESSLQYRSVVLFGRFEALDARDRLSGLDAIADAILPGRRAEVRHSTQKELAATLVLAMPITRWSLKIRNGGPDDPPEDVATEVWAGVVPLAERYGEPVPAPDMRPGIAVPASVRALAGSG